MTTICVPSDPVDVILPKGAFDPNAKNYFGDRLEKAGYDKPLRRGCGRQGIVQGDVRFCSAKDPSSLRTRLERMRACGVIFSANGLREAILSMCSASRGQLTKVLSMGIGPCRMRFLSRTQLSDAGDIRGACIDTEFPSTLRALLRLWGIAENEVTLNATSSADELAALVRENIAFDITQRGESARELGFVVNDCLPYPDQQNMIIEPAAIPFQQITTDGYGWNIASMQEIQRDKLAAFFYAMEMADRSRSVVSLKFIIPMDRVDEFRSMQAVYAPTIAPCIGKLNAAELDVWVPVDDAPNIIWELRQKGVRSIGRSSPFQVDAENSEVFNVFQQFER